MTPAIASAEHTIAFRVTRSPIHFTAIGKTMTGVSEPMMATLAIEVMRTEVKYERDVQTEAARRRATTTSTRPT